MHLSSTAFNITFFKTEAGKRNLAIRVFVLQLTVYNALVCLLFLLKLVILFWWGNFLPMFVFFKKKIPNIFICAADILAKGRNRN